MRQNGRKRKTLIGFQILLGLKKMLDYYVGNVITNSPSFGRNEGLLRCYYVIQFYACGCG